MEVATSQCYADSPFVDSIALVSMPKGFTTPTMTFYDGTEDPLEPINPYKQKMMVVAATGPKKEECMCKGFSSTLSGAALQWCDPTTAVNAFRRGLHRDSDLYKDLTKHPCATFEEVKQMAEATYRLEEDEDRRDLYGTESSIRKITTEKKNERAKPYSKNTVNKVSGETESTEAPPKLSEYGFTTRLAGVMKVIRELGQRARWLKKPTPRQNDRRDARKRCEYHNDIGHNTEDCIVLRKEVKHLYSAGCLNHLLPMGAKSGKILVDTEARESIIFGNLEEHGVQRERPGAQGSTLGRLQRRN
ncbi:uncharacterized protein LOC141617554 [Silene latifolia]|uniref:uncharacterized protein LOC141617554 n=1 Tax=Silene latifolia TaxID=37657 RepID=UPI003D77BCA5